MVTRVWKRKYPKRPRYTSVPNATTDTVLGSAARHGPAPQHRTRFAGCRHHAIAPTFLSFGSSSPAASSGPRPGPSFMPPRYSPPTHTDGTDVRPVRRPSCARSAAPSASSVSQPSIPGPATSNATGETLLLHNRPRLRAWHGAQPSARVLWLGTWLLRLDPCAQRCRAGRRRVQCPRHRARGARRLHGGKLKATPARWRSRSACAKARAPASVQVGVKAVATTYRLQATQKTLHLRLRMSLRTEWRTRPSCVRRSV